ncbi:MAG: DUF1759 domain-containing protein [Cytophagales bacterium]|nr:DUF1759 domain-containing protein [Cytophagales bacterium]
MGSEEGDKERSSGYLRQQIGLAKKRLTDYFNGLQDPFPLIDHSVTLEENLQLMKRKKRGLMEEKEKLERAVLRLDKLGREWTQFIAEIDDKTEEQQRYDHMANGEEGFLELMERAEDRLAITSAWLPEIDNERRDLLVQSAMEERDQYLEQQQPINARMSDAQSGSPNAVNNDRFVKLPQLTISPFDGNILKFPEFFETFENSIHKSNLAPVLKFTHLRTLLRGRALDAIEGISITNDNYELALKILDEKFGDKEVLRDKLYGQLRNIFPVKSGKQIELRSFVDKLEKVLRQLDKLGEQVEQPSIVSLINGKLPIHLLIKLEEDNYKDNQDGMPWTVKRLQEGLGRIVKFQDRAFQMSSWNSEANHLSHVQSKFTQLKVGSEDPKKFTNTFAVTQQEPRNFQGVRKLHCLLCEGTHYADECSIYKSLDSRKRRLRELRRCFLCLRQNCLARECKQPMRRCFHCGGQHARLLCPKKFGSVSEPERCAQRRETSGREPLQRSLQQGNSKQAGAPKLSGFEAWGVYTSNSSCTHGSVRHMVAHVEVINPDNGNALQACVFLDGGSDRTVVTEKFANSLGLPEKASEKLSVMTFGHAEALELEIKLVNLQLCLKEGSRLDIVANRVPMLTGTLEEQPLSKEDREKLREMSEVVCVDELFEYGSQLVVPDILIGIEYYHRIVGGWPPIELPSGLYLLKTQLGHIVSGREKVRVQVCTEQVCMDTEFETVTEESPQDKDLPRPIDFPDISEFWSLESIGIKDDPERKDDEIAMHQFMDTVFFEDGRYVVSWPWKVAPEKLNDNYALAIGRFRSLAKRLQADKPLQQKYIKIIKEQEENGIIELVDTRVCHKQGNCILLSLFHI